MGKSVRSRAPLRLGLAGGGSDVSPYCDIYGGYVLNTTIDKYAYTTIHSREDKLVEFIATDLNLRGARNLEDDSYEGDQVPLHNLVFQHMFKIEPDKLKTGLTICTHTDAAPGSGLGSSSTLVVSILKAFVEYLNLPSDNYYIAELAHKIEREEYKIKGGKQDQYSAAFGGFNFIEFPSNGLSPIVNPLKIKNWIICELESSLVIYYTGLSRDSGKIISDQSETLLNNSKALQSMHYLKEEAVIMKNALLKGDIDALCESINRGWIHKKNTSNSISNPEINSLFNCAKNNHALAGKISGAGGGGYCWFIVLPENKMKLMRSLNNLGGTASACHFVSTGCEAWTL